jgi:hypothetical protein
VAGTLPPTVSPVPHEQVTDIDFVGSLSDVAFSVTEPDDAEPAAFSM